ncbi:hypothetical protein EUTSA_v10014934mg [Eutrema salsugineum]|uniref:Oxidoreductase-like domain-containing protein n=1 Tax=Eutrema salsugineum TaxID=72664 RepID=V4KUT2_EUTSA|nr:uncharacterized protein LOC18018697 [Eutrema salsugineum]ESQ41715.1 hypothetical protein EUTSA_v10014934mg [Eutrema salsugineum]
MVLLHHRPHLHPRISVAISPDYNHRQTSFDDVLLSMRFGLTRVLPLKRSFAYYSITSGSREQQPKSPITMATKSGDLVETSTVETCKGEEDKMKEVKKEEVSLPPPPEKPEPGDCCGNGCVRCVWDLYYEELEEYNTLSSSISGETKSS